MRKTPSIGVDCSPRGDPGVRLGRSNQRSRGGLARLSRQGWTRRVERNRNPRDTPEGGLKVAWRTPVKIGYGGPAVANGRVFLMDFEYTTRPRGIERVLALDEKTGKVLWTQQWEVSYAGVSYDRGPRATPTVDGDLVYVQGTVGHFVCLNAKTGEVVWKKDFAKEYGASVETARDGWGFVAPGLIDGDRVISRVAGDPNVIVAAFDKRTGKEIWRALPKGAGMGYASLDHRQYGPDASAHRVARLRDRVTRFRDGQDLLGSSVAPR